MINSRRRHYIIQYAWQYNTQNVHKETQINKPVAVRNFKGDTLGCHHRKKNYQGNTGQKKRHQPIHGSKSTKKTTKTIL